MTRPGRERAPQEVTPVRVARATPGPLEGGAWPAASPPAPAARAASDDRATGDRAAADAGRLADLERDVRNVRRRALATLAYAGGAVASFATGTQQHIDVMILPFAFCSMGALVGAAWTAITARRVRHGGISLGDALGSGWRDALARQEGRRRGAVRTARATLVDDDVAASSYGVAVRRAVDDRNAIADLVARLGPADSAMLPDVLPTVEALVRRVAELASSLHRLDLDASPGRLAELDARVAEAQRAPSGAPDRDRRLELLVRQRASLADLVQRREQLAVKLESATLVLQNIRLDLLRLRSSGIESALEEFTSATREAGALSTEIGRALDVARELRARDA